MHGIAEYRQTTSPGIPHCLGYTLRDLGHLPASKTRRALLAYLLCARHGLSLRGGARLVGVSLTYVRAVSRLSPEQRAQLISGDLKLSNVVNGHRHSRFPKNMKPTDDEADRLVASIGYDRVMAALDRYTQPRLFAAE